MILHHTWAIAKILILALALFGLYGIFAERPWESASFAVEGEKNSSSFLDTLSAGEAARYPYAKPERGGANAGSLLRRGLSYIGIGGARTDDADERKRMEGYFRSTAALFPSKEELPLAVLLYRNDGNRDALLVAIDDMKKGGEGLKLLSPPEALGDIHQDTLLLVEDQIRMLEDISALPLPNEDAFREFMERGEQQDIIKRSARLADEMRSLIRRYNLSLPASIFGE